MTPRVNAVQHLYIAASEGMLDLGRSPPWFVHLIQLFHAEKLSEENRKARSGANMTHLATEKPKGAPDWMP